ncbi:uncharacterized protein LOC126108631 [Schistocerca cancellata]|uniref:uncharacterized protein LOC126108631 n=1 Tax=Schistocerca cancellata TaxID=274614 RepID=UPI002118AE19|nr:uncharacterized protein LOC126108631 [Schistocerca cancellata]
MLSTNLVEVSAFPFLIEPVMNKVDLYPYTFIMNIKQEPEDYENEVDLYPHTFIMNIKQEPKDYENKFTEGPPITAECSVRIKEDPELDLGVDVIENGVSRYLYCRITTRQKETVTTRKRFF